MAALRLLLDAHISHRSVGEPWRAQGFDVLALQQQPELDALTDEMVLELAAAQERILITRNSRDFAPLLRAWAEAGRTHGGCILIWTLTHAQSGEIVRRVGDLLQGRPTQEEWINATLAI